MSKILCLFLFMLLTACLPERTLEPVSDDTNDNEETDSSLDQTSVYFQHQGKKSTGAVALPLNFNDTIFLKGSSVSSFAQLNQGGPSLCLALPMVEGVLDKVLILALIPKSELNYSNYTNVYSYQLLLNAQEANSQRCGSAQMSAQFPGKTLVYQTEDICEDCPSFIKSSAPLVLSSQGASIEQLDLSNFSFILTPGGVVAPGSSIQCTQNSTCTYQGYDCCSGNLCVNHGGVKSGVNTSGQEYLDAASDVNSNPSHLSLYPEIFNICTSGSNSGNTTPPTSGNPALPISEKEALYYCLNPIKGELAYCTASFNLSSNSFAGSESKLFLLPLGDISFNSLNGNLSANNIQEIYLGDQLVFEDGKLNLSSELGKLINANDNLTQGQSLELNKNAITTPETLTIRYKTDASCETVSSSSVKCSKTYIQGQVSTPAHPYDHPSSQSFKIPSYASSSDLIVKINGETVDESKWSVSGNTIRFQQLTVFDRQTVQIEYYVTNGAATISSSKESAQEQINNLCACTNGVNCELKPVYINNDEDQGIANFDCAVKQDGSSSSFPLQKTVYISAKTVAHRFYDSNGIYYKYDDINDKRQECAQNNGNEENCAHFEYESNDPYRPNNLNQYIGFNEIYGSFNTGNSPAISATEVLVEKGKTYNLFTAEGTFSSCLDCGVDYYSNMAKIFPESFVHKGAGYYPDFVAASRLNNKSGFNADDMRFGKACFVPATMLPWSHKQYADINLQRRMRLQTQHFLFANGYNKDWYGFDYGSLIGSFDGVKWFAIGNQRNIVAKSNKLFIAINAYYGDQTQDNSYKLSITEASSVVNSGSQVTSDILNDGAQCQQAHVCETDKDCIGQLGYDYSCEDVSSISTSWPVFNESGNEVSGSETKTIVSLIGGINGYPKRCVYRGRGSLCSRTPSNTTGTNSYAGTDALGVNSCSSNQFCAPISAAKFNRKIARVPKDLNSINANGAALLRGDTIGLKAKIMGRPFNYFGNETAPGNVYLQLLSNKVQGMCVPGKAVTSSLNADHLNDNFASVGEADSNFQIGRTFYGTVAHPRYLNSCPTTNDAGEFTFKAVNPLDLNEEASHGKFSITQNTSTNVFSLSSLSSSGIYNNDSGPKTEIGYERNSCLRNPGASCFSDLDCSVNSFVKGKFEAISNFAGELSEAELAYWSEDLVCANDEEKTSDGFNPNPSYNGRTKRCCRETDKNFTYYSQPMSGSDFKVKTSGGDPRIAGVTTNINDPLKYSRIQTIYDLLVTSPEDYPQLITPNSDTATKVMMGTGIDTDQFELQYKTLDAHNSRMCCTQNWVREFAGGGHQFTGDSGQSINLDRMRALNWLPTDTPGDYSNQGGSPFQCDATSVDNATFCKARHITEGSAYETKWLSYFSKLELTGVPQIFIESWRDEHYRPVSETQEDGSAVKQPLEDIISGGTTPAVEDFNMNGLNYYSAASAGKVSSKLDFVGTKKIFSSETFNCCIPTGREVGSTVSNEQCCTGQVGTRDGARFCCLNDFADLSVYTNRYISSEASGLNSISDSDVDEAGYVSKEIVKAMGATMCCSGRAEYGVAISELYAPTNTGYSTVKKFRRFVENSGHDNLAEVNSAYARLAAGVKWNNHVYCVPSDF